MLLVPSTSSHSWEKYALCSDPITTCLFFLQNTQNKHPIVQPWGCAMECFLWVPSLIHVLLLSFPCCVKYHVVFDCVILKFDIISNATVSGKGRFLQGTVWQRRKWFHLRWPHEVHLRLTVPRKMFSYYSHMILHWTDELHSIFLLDFHVQNNHLKGKWWVTLCNSFPPGQNGRRSDSQHFKCIFFNKNDRIPIQISPKFVPRSPISQ